jgi:putative ABC transport system substrate-binding protein
MRRRMFLSMLLATAAIPRKAVAQTRRRTYRLGYFVLNRLTEPPSAERAGFIAGLADLGYVAGTNLVIEYRSAESDRERLPFLADELVQAKVDAIVVTSSDPARAASQATKTVPIIMLGIGDPIEFGLVTNLARPGANITGMSWQSVDLIGKRFALLKEVLPGARRAAYLWNPETVEGGAGYSAATQPAREAGLVLDELPVTDAATLQRAIETLERARSDVLYVNIDPIVATYRQIVADVAIRLRIPSISGYRGYAEAGGLMSYGASLTELYRRAAKYVDQIFRGAKPGDLPIEQPTRFDLVINQKTAKAIGVAIPQSLLLRAELV